jgi:N-acetylmuramic acid 6-phosphate etherase
MAPVVGLSPTEQRNARTLDIDQVPTLQLLELLNAEDRVVADAVRAVLPELATVVDAAIVSLSKGARVHYFGAGTSGRIAVMDAAELIPTFGLEPGRFVAHHAGGDRALERPIEQAEDDEQLGAAAASGVGDGDVVIGISASGRTPFVAGALRATRAKASLSALITANPEPPIGPLADVVVAAAVGPEAIAGSTRLKAATAQKLLLNSFSTATMIRLGRTYSNLMIEVAPTNVKLRARMLNILEQASGAPRERCSDALAAAADDLKLALVCLLCGASLNAARAALEAADGQVRLALEQLAAADGVLAHDDTLGKDGDHAEGSGGTNGDLPNGTAAVTHRATGAGTSG